MNAYGQISGRVLTIPQTLGLQLIKANWIVIFIAFVFKYGVYSRSICCAAIMPAVDHNWWKIASCLNVEKSK